MSDIQLLADVNAYKLYSIRQADKKFNTFKESVIKRDKSTCSYCTFKAHQHMTVINNDGNYQNNSMENLVTACLFCAQCHFLPFVGKVEGTGGVLIHLPDMSQSDLNALCHVLFCTMYHKAKYHENAEKIYKSLKLRSKLIDDCWGEGLSKPSHFGQMIIDTPSEKIKSVKHEILSQIRLLPSYKAFASEIDIWSRNALEQGVLGL